MLMKLTPGVVFTDIITSSLYLQRFKKQKKKTVKSPVFFFALLGLACAKVARKMLLKFTPGWLYLFLEKELFLGENSVIIPKTLFKNVVL